MEIGTIVIYKEKEYKVLGHAAREDQDGNPFIEIAWNNQELSLTGYFAVPIKLLKVKR